MEIAVEAVDANVVQPGPGQHSRMVLAIASRCAPELEGFQGQSQELVVNFKAKDDLISRPI